MKTTKTETKAKFQTQFEKKRKVTCWIRLIYFIVIVAPFLYMITTTNVWFVVFLSAATFLLSGWLWTVTNNIKLRPRDSIRDMKVQLKIWSDRIVYLKDLGKISLEDIHKLRILINEEEVKEEYQTAAEEIKLCEDNIEIANQKVDYLKHIKSFWQYFIGWRWLKKQVEPEAMKEKMTFSKWLGRVMWRFLVLLYGLLLFPMDFFEALFDPDGDHSLERTKVTFKMHWYHY